MRVKIVLDFDGVVFDSAAEAHAVANRACADWPGYRRQVGLDEFLAFRRNVTDAWQYNRLYDQQRQTPSSALSGLVPCAADKAFARAFFAARAALMAEGGLHHLMPPYDFFRKLQPLLREQPDDFAILSTRNAASIRAVLASHGVALADVFGQEDVSRLGGKLAVAQAQGWLEHGRWLVAYVDDMRAHLAPFRGRIHLPLHAGWGYDAATPDSLSPAQTASLIGSLLTSRHALAEAAA
jgi:hypothetical protein